MVREVYMNAIIREEISHMSIEEKILLVEDLWDIIAASEEDIDLTDTQIKELEQRDANYKKNPDSARSWESFKADLEKA